MGNALHIDKAVREAACAYATFDGSKEGALRLRYMTAHDLAFNRAFRNLLAYRKQRQKEREAGSERETPSEATPDAPVAVLQPTKANPAPPLKPTVRPSRVETAPSQAPATLYNPPKPHSRQ